MIEEIKIPLPEYHLEDKEENSKDYLENCSKINIFVGQNNSGKSRLLRELFSSKELELRLREVDYHKVNLFIKKLKEDIEYFFETKHRSFHPDINTILKDMEEITFPNENFDLVTYLTRIENIGKNMLKNENTTWGSTPHIVLGKQILEIYDAVILEIFGEGFKFDDRYGGKEYFKTYIPMLRGLRPIAPKGEEGFYLNNNVYQKRTYHDYFGGVAGQIALHKSTEVFTGLDIYDKIEDMVRGTHDQRNLIIEYEKFLEEYFFNEPVALIPKKGSDVLLVKIGDQDERLIYKLGDGMQTIIICTFPLFMNKLAKTNEKLLLFIEEPELTLHPEMQRKLIEAYCNHEEDVQIFLTTHSNHLLDITLDYEEQISIFSFEKKSDEEFIIKNITPNREILDLLGIRNSSVFLTNCIIWVEGISDRIYINSLLKKYFKLSSGKEYLEDKHYSILEYGGGNVTHFNFFEEDESEKINILNVNHNNFILADNDLYDVKTGKKKDGSIDEKGVRLKYFNDNLDNFFAKHIEIENLIPYKYYEKYLTELFSEKPSKKIKLKSSLGEEDDFNSRLEKEKIGKLIKDFFVEKENEDDELKYFDKDDISCLKEDKKNVANGISKFILNDDFSELDKWLDSLPETTKELLENLIKFIEKNNK